MDSSPQQENFPWGNRGDSCRIRRSAVRNETCEDLILAMLQRRDAWNMALRTHGHRKVILKVNRNATVIN